MLPYIAYMDPMGYEKITINKQNLVPLKRHHHHHHQPPVVRPHDLVMFWGHGFLIGKSLKEMK
jgi:hypothetical protein